jgi:hypothetical protein
MILNILVSACCVVSFLNLIFTILLSNSLFRIASRNPSSPEEPESSGDAGLIDVKPTPTYDTRFRQEKR